MSKTHLYGFTLAELLIALMILGQIAAFAIPKILNAQQLSSSKSAAKEDISMIAAAYQLYALNNTVSSSTGFAGMTQYLNYVKVDTSSTIDDIPTLSTNTCAANAPCLRMHNGSVLQYWDFENFGGSSTTHAVYFIIDPDGRVTDGTTNGPGKSMPILLFYNGRLSDPTQTGVSCCNTFGWGSQYIPSWFSW